jgi:hypothetical protein
MEPLDHSYRRFAADIQEEGHWDSPRTCAGLVHLAPSLLMSVWANHPKETVYTYSVMEASLNPSEDPWTRRLDDQDLAEK